MGLEAGTYIADLVATNPGGGDFRYEGDNHVRLIKSTLLATFPGFTGRIGRLQAKGSGYTVVAGDNFSVIDCTAALTLTWTAVATLGNGHTVLVNARGGDVVIDPNASELVNGAATLTVPNGSMAWVTCDGTKLDALLAPRALSAYILTLLDDANASAARATLGINGVGGVIATGDIANNAVDNTKIRQGVARSVIGVTGNATANVADIQGGADQVLVVNGAGTALAFGQVATAGIVNNAVDNTKIRDSGPLSVIGRSVNSSGDPADISATAASDAVLRESGSGVGFGTIATGGLANNAVTYAKMQDFTATQRINARNTAGSGDPEEVTVSQVLDWISSTRGALLERGAAGWSAITPGTSGFALVSNGAGADPTYQDVIKPTFLDAKGDLISASANDTPSKLTVGNDGDILFPNSGATAGLQWLKQPFLAGVLFNGKLVPSVGSNALTVALKGVDGNDPSATNPVFIAFRSSTASSGDWNVRKVTAATSVVVSSGSTLGHASARDQHVFVYAIDNAGTVELAVSNLPPDALVPGAGRVVSTTAEGGAGAADSAIVVYSTTARSNVPYACLAKMVSNQTTAGTWAAAPTQVDHAPFQIPVSAFMVRRAAAQTMTNTVWTKVNWDTEDVDTNAEFDSTTNFRFQPKIAGWYKYAADVGVNGSVAGSSIQVRLSKNGSALHAQYDRFGGTGGGGTNLTGLQFLNGTTDYIEIEVLQDSGGDQGFATSYNSFSGGRTAAGFGF